MVVVIGLGVTFSTFLSGPVAMLATLGALAGGFFNDYMFRLATGQTFGGGPFESLIRLVTQQTITGDMEPGLSTTVAKTLDQAAEHLLRMMSSILPDFGRFSFADYVASGFDVSGETILTFACRAVAFVVPVFVVGYLCLKNPRNRAIVGRVESRELRARGLAVRGFAKQRYAMTSRSSFVRKIVYLVAIAVLLMPLFWLSQPATTAAKGVQGSPGGVLAQLRDDPEHPLSQAQLGQIDPTSVTIKLATLGMRGIAANILWEKANDFKLKKDWANFGATLNQITKVQPNFVSIWLNQAWNVSYNISVQFDNYRERYRYVIKGCDFLKRGDQVQQSPAAAALGIGLDDRAKDRPGRRAQTVSAGCSRKTRTFTARAPWPSATTGWWARSGSRRP